MKMKRPKDCLIQKGTGICKDCPRYFDDCDGVVDDELEK